MLSAAKGSSILTAGRLFELAGGFVIAFLLARLLGAEEYGLYSLSFKLAMLVAGMSSLGLDSAVLRYVAMLNAKQDEAGIWGTLQVTVSIAFASSLLMGGVLYLAAGVVAEHLFHDPRLQPLLQVFGVLVPCLALSNVLVGAAHGFKRMDYSVIARSFVQLFVRLTLVVILAVIGLDAFRVAIIFGISDLAASLTLVYLLNQQFPLVRPWENARWDTREIVSFSWPLWFSGLLKKFRKNIEIVLLGSLGTVTHVGIFTLAKKINQLSHIGYQSICASVKPVFAELTAQEDWQQMDHLYTTTTRWAFTLNLPMFLVLITCGKPILAVFGESFVSGASVLVILALTDLIVALTGTCGSVIDMTGHTRLKLMNSLAWITLLTAGNLVLIPRWGLPGAAVATLVATSTVNLARVVEVYVLFRLNPYSRDILKPMICGLAAYGAATLVGWWSTSPTSYLVVVLQAFMLFATYTGLLLVLGITPDDRTVLARLIAKAQFVFGKPSAVFRRWLPTGR